MDEFYEGQRVQVKDWDEMADEYGMADVYIDCPLGFVPGMRSFCGTVFTIMQVQEDEIILEEPESRRYHWSKEMLKPYDEQADEPDYAFEKGISTFL